MLQVINRRRLIANIPFFAAKAMAFGFDMLSAVTLGLIINGVLTRDQVKQLGSDNVVADDAKGFADLGITPTSIGVVIPEYLYRFRPSGQYDAIKASAKNLKA
jgi:NADH dehydrogenase